MRPNFTVKNMIFINEISKDTIIVVCIFEQGIINLYFPNRESNIGSSSDAGIWKVKKLNK